MIFSEENYTQKYFKRTFSRLKKNREIWGKNKTNWLDNYFSFV